jgi:hypothetical protein
MHVSQEMHAAGSSGLARQRLGRSGCLSSGRESEKYSIPVVLSRVLITDGVRFRPTRITGTLTLSAISAAKSRNTDSS